MDVEESKYFGLCKCCLRDGCFRSMWAEYAEGGAVHNYGEMLNECFALNWEKPGNELLDQICDSCTRRVKDAHSFWRQVLTSHDHLSNVKHEECVVDVANDDEMYEDMEVLDEYTGLIKTEVSNSDNYNDPNDIANSPDDPAVFADDPNDPDYLEDPEDAQDSDNPDYLDDPESCDGVKEEYQEVEYLELEGDRTESVEPAAPQRPGKRRGGRRVYKNYTIEDLQHSVAAAASGEMTAAEAALRYNVPRKTIAAKMLSEKRGEIPKPSAVTANRNRYYRLIDEVKLLLTYTNVTPYKTKTAHYHCAYCSTTGPLFEDPDELRTHTRTMHAGERTRSVEQFLRPLWLNEVLKVDIENLHCTVCCTILVSWNDMFQHLKQKHDLDFDDAYTRVIPYILTRELRCALCKEPFPNYHHLDGHMNAHYNNYMCSECGDTFLSETRLKKHLKIHNIGKFRCDCGKTFTLEKYRKKHIELVHKQAQNIKCLYCNEKFLGTYPRHLHVMQCHREKVSFITCELCGKTFDWRPYYLVHVRRKHNNEKNHECEVCHVQFFLKSELKRHKATHRDRKFVYVTKKS